MINMRMRILFLIVALFVLSAPTAFAQAKVAPLDIKERTLANGLRVVSVQDNTSPTVSIHVWYDVGGKNDPPGRSGFAHMFEHMMFKATKNMPNEKMDRLTEDVGGFNNASTWPDYTNYYEVVPSNHLEPLLWAEADRMVNLNVDEKNFASEREVVKEEYRQSVLAPPYGQLFWLLDDITFQKHPYRRGVIGDLEQLSAATPADAEKFYKDFYRPDNAVLIVVGDFDQKQFDSHGSTNISAALQSRPEALPRVTEAEPEWTTERRFNETGPSVPFPATQSFIVLRRQTAPIFRPCGSPRSILSGRRKFTAVSMPYPEPTDRPGGGPRPRTEHRRRPNVFDRDRVRGRNVRKSRKGLLAELKKIQDGGVTAKELEKAKNQLVSRGDPGPRDERRQGDRDRTGGCISGRSQSGKQRGATASSRDRGRFQRVMKQYFKDNNRVVIYYNQAKKAEGAK